MPPTDHPLAFGQHANSDMAASIDDANTLIDTLVSLQPRVVKAVDEEAVDPLAAQCVELLQQTPEPFSVRAVKEKLENRSDPDPLKTVLYQELDRSVFCPLRQTALSSPSSLSSSLLPGTSDTTSCCTRCVAHSPRS